MTKKEIIQKIESMIEWEDINSRKYDKLENEIIKAKYVHGSLVLNELLRCIEMGGK